LLFYHLAGFEAKACLCVSCKAANAEKQSWMLCLITEGSLRRERTGSERL